MISFASRTLTEAERNYHLHSGKLEFLALKWAITDKFSNYLKYGPHFYVYTDNNPLTYVLTTAKLNAVGLRWVAELADFNFTIKYRPGKVNIDADYLSRNAMEIDDFIKECTEVCEPEMIDTVISAVTACSERLCNVSVEKLILKPEEDVLRIEKVDLVNAQKNDDTIGPVYQAVMKGHRPGKEEWKELTRGSKLLLHHFDKLILEDGVLFRKIPGVSKIILPEKFHHIVYTELHENMAHLCPEKVIDLAQQRFYWPYMAKQITHYIQKKCRCVISKKPNISEKAPLVPIESNHPFEVIAIDFMHLDKAKGGFEYVMIVCDHFTRFTQAYATRSKSSAAAAEKLFHEYILQYGFPKRVHHDRGPEFNSRLFKELHRLTGIKASNTTPYHPMGNGQVERMNRTFRNMLTTLSENDKRNWNKHLSKLAFAYNSTVNKSTSFSPFYLMFGRKSILPIDYIFQNEGPTQDLKNRSHQKFVDDWAAEMQEAYKIAKEHMQKSSQYNKRYYDRKVKEIEVLPGDHVLIKNVKEKGGTGKLKSYWEPNIFEVVEKAKNLPVYTLQNLNKKQDRRIIHRNLLMKCNDLPVELFQSNEIQKSKKQQNQKRKQLLLPKVTTEESETEDEFDVEITFSQNSRGGKDVETDESEVVARENETRSEEEIDFHKEATDVRDGEIITLDEESDSHGDETNFRDDVTDSGDEATAVRDEEIITLDEESDSREDETNFRDDETDDSGDEELDSRDDDTDSLDDDTDSRDKDLDCKEELHKENLNLSSEESEVEYIPEENSRPVRIRHRPPIFTYHSIGGNPVLE